jgi:hypothetical protein
MRVVVPLASALLLGACATGQVAAPDAGATAAAPPPSAAPSEWRIERSADRASGTASVMAFVTTMSTTAREAFPRQAVLHLLCFKGEPIVRLAFRFRIGTTRSATVAYRFDEQPGREPKARILQDYKTVVIEDRAEVARFVADMKDAEKLHVRITSLTVGRTFAEFRVADAPAAVDATFAACPLPADPPRRRAGA